MSNFDETVIDRLKRLEREVERLRVKERPADSITDHGLLNGLADNDHPQYLLTTGKAADSNRLDGLDSTAFLLTTGKAADSDKLDGVDSTGFAVASHNHDATYLGITGKAADSDKLDGLDSTAFLLATHLTDGTGCNYSITTGIYVFEGTHFLAQINIYDRLGNNQTSANRSSFNINGELLNLTSPRTFYIRDANYWKWVDYGIATHVKPPSGFVPTVDGNDGQLFVYAINNNGSLMFGVSQCPTLTTVAGNYAYNYAQAAGSIGYNNMVTEAAVAAGNTCRVIGRINVRQCADTQWIEPKQAKIVNKPIFSTDILSFTPIFVSWAANCTNLFMSYYIRDSVCHMEGGTKAGSVCTVGGTNAQPIQFAPPFPAKDSTMQYSVDSTCETGGSWGKALSGIQAGVSIYVFKPFSNMWTSGDTINNLYLRTEYPVDE